MKKIIALSIFSLMLFSGCDSNTSQTDPNNDSGEKVEFTKVKAVIEKNCTVCHSATPTFEGYSRAPGSTILDTAEQMKTKASRINARVSAKTMPLKSSELSLTDEEISLISSWVDQGANIE